LLTLPDSAKVLQKKEKTGDRRKMVLKEAPDTLKISYCLSVAEIRFCWYYPERLSLDAK